MNNITFERAAAADAGALVKVEIASFNDESRIYAGIDIGGPPGYDSVVVMLQKIQEADAYKIVHDGQIIGGIVVYNEGQGHLHLDLIFVATGYHNRGIGTQAMQFLDQAYTAKKWTLDTPGYAVRNQHFYEKFGYIKVGEEQLDGFTLIAYEKNL